MYDLSCKRLNADIAAEEPALSEERSVLQGRLEDDPAVLRIFKFPLTCHLLLLANSSITIFIVESKIFENTTPPARSDCLQPYRPGTVPLALGEPLIGLPMRGQGLAFTSQPWHSVYCFRFQRRYLAVKIELRYFVGQLWTE